MPFTRTPRLAVSAIFALNGALFGVWAARIPAFVARFELAPGELGLLLLCIAGGAIAAFQTAGRLSDSYGAATVSRYGIGLYVVAMLTLPLWPSVWLLALGLIAFGATYGATDVAMNAWAAEVEHTTGRPIMASFHAMYSLGAGIGAGTGWAAAALSVPPAPHFWAVALPTAALTAWAAAVPWRSTLGPESAPGIALPRGTLLLVGVIAFASSVGEGAMADWSAVFLIDVTGTTEAQAALGFAAFSTTMVAMRLAGDRAIAGLGPVAVARASGLVATAGIALLILSPGLVPALLGFALLGLGYAVIFPLVVTRAAAEPGIAAGRAIASVATLGYGGMLLGPALIGAIAAVLSLPVAFALVGALALAITALAPNLRP